jgi:hypothetical protein
VRSNNSRLRSSSEDPSNTKLYIFTPQKNNAAMMNAKMEEPEKPNKQDELMEKFAGGMMKFDNKFLEQRKIFLWGGVHDESAEKLVNRLLFLEANDPGKDIFFYINSPGGVVTSGMVVYDVMQMISVTGAHHMHGTCCLYGLYSAERWRQRQTQHLETWKGDDSPAIAGWHVWSGYGY